MLRLVGLAALEEQHVGLHALRIEDAGRQAQDRVQVAQVHQPRAQPPPRVVLEQHVVGHDHGGAAARLQRADDVLDKGKLLVRRVRRDREVGARRPTAALLGAERRIGQDEIGLGQRLAIRRQRVDVVDAALDAVQQQVHHAEPMRVGHKLRPDEGVVPLEEGLRLRQLVEVVRVVLDVAVGGDEEAGRAGGGSCTISPGCGCISRTMQSISGRGVKYWPAPDFLSEAFFSSRPS